ncbi:MAG: hypothetical protein CEN89_338 [Candidatus Berkelbacteria bacterium Licking1014_7]|uniref:Uncharacterized protein n=1 Tax=Candidatus Berkelbacteria bacterium Licking1014_7 TaxID=2017147 RepID=A0A554LJB7_9BACT|nr:MAG: hypothetical protein CEN89_338 [Candidatus Berkelbacteria bacterium Licking1014_7]
MVATSIWRQIADDNVLGIWLDGPVIVEIEGYAPFVSHKAVNVGNHIIFAARMLSVWFRHYSADQIQVLELNTTEKRIKVSILPFSSTC